MISVNPNIYTIDYYLKYSGKIDEFLRFVSKDKSKRIKYLDSLIILDKKSKILDIGCGVGNHDIYFAKKGANVIGVDYSINAINIAKKNLSKESNAVKNRINFIHKDIKKINFKENSFDIVLAIDVFEHLYKEELEIVMKKIKKILKNNGLLIVHTEANRLYLDYTHKYYVYPVSNFLIKINYLLTKKKYKGLNKNPRSKLHIEQHVNEPTIFYLKKIFKKYRFRGKILSLISLIKPIISWKDFTYNLIVLLYPLCFIFPLKYFFAYDYLCIMKNEK